jgi:hypothetical protein
MVIIFGQNCPQSPKYANFDNKSYILLFLVLFRVFERKEVKKRQVLTKKDNLKISGH